MKNFNKFSFDKFLESRDKSLYREVRITSAIKTHMDTEKTQIWHDAKNSRDYIIQLIGSDDEKLNMHPMNSLKFLDFFEEDSKAHENLKTTMSLLLSTQRTFLSDWDSLSDPSKNESLGFISFHTQNLLHHCGLVGEIQEFFIHKKYLLVLHTFIPLQLFSQLFCKIIIVLIIPIFLPILLILNIFFGCVPICNIRKSSKRFFHERIRRQKFNIQVLQ